MPPPVPPRHVLPRIARALAPYHAATLLLVALPAAVRAESLPELLEAVAAGARFASPARADVRIECPEGCPTAGGQAILLGRGDAVYVETKGGQRALVRPGRVLVATGGKATEAAVGQTLADTDLLLEDLAVFSPSSLKLPQISDDGPAGVVVTAAPGAASAYSLLVHTIDRERHVIQRTLYYRELVNNLTKTRRDADFVQLAGGWRPREIGVDSVRRATKTRLVLAWRDAPDVPAALFEPAGLEKPSGLVWP